MKVQCFERCVRCLNVMVESGEASLRGSWKGREKMAG